MRSTFLKTSGIILLLLFVSHLAVGQLSSYDKLDEVFFDYEVRTLNSEKITSLARTGDFFSIAIPKNDGGSWEVELHNSHIISEDYFSQYADDSGVHISNHELPVPTEGYVKGDYSTAVSLTFNNGFIYGFIRDEDGYHHIEPVSHFEKNMEVNDLYVIYDESRVRPSAPMSCGVHDHNTTRDNVRSQIEKNGIQKVVDECFEVDWPIANDFLMFQDFGSVAGTENHAVGVVNNVQTNYDDEFADEIQFVITTQFTATSSASDPWTTTENASILLDDFLDWAPSGFGGAARDVTSLWTGRDIFAIDDEGNDNYSVIGLAYVGVVCSNGFGGNVLENFTSNPNTKRVMVAHELGHNFNSFHDAGSGHIMAPFVSTATTWSAQSTNAIENHIATRTCLADCADSSVPPSANFVISVIENCTPGEVIFTNTSTGPNLTYSWSFPGGTPSSSTQESPNITYFLPGVFDATLTVTNSAGTDIATQTNQIVIDASPDVNFAFANNGTETSFFNISTNADGYFWDFGDGNSSSLSDPVHDYGEDGVYTVTLTGFNANCGDETFTQIVTIATPPTADFETETQSGCAVFEVEFTSNSSNNTDDFEWSFPGGTPETSTEENPVVLYDETGNYDVTLTVYNETGEGTLTLQEYISVLESPLADFTFVVDGNEVTFTNFSVFGEEFTWSFGDGSTSTEENPTHEYAEDGEYTVTLTVENECGINSVDTEVVISLLPVPSFTITTGSSMGCTPLEIGFESTSSNNPDTYNWIFEGGSPATSTEENPTITYSEAGSYDITLSVTNANGTNSVSFPDFVVVIDGPTSGFTYMESGLTVDFSDQSTGASDYNWDFGDGNTSTLADPTYTYDEEGIYTVSLTVTNECGTSTISESINNYTAVSASFSTNTTSGCADLDIDFMDQSSDNVTTWSWTFAGGEPANSTIPNPTVTYSSPGQYDVVLTVSNPEFSETITMTNYIAVSDIPETSFEYFDDLFDVDFTNTTIEGVTFAWDFGDGNTSNMENPSHTFMSEGEYEVTLIATNECGSSTMSQVVIINALPTAGISSDDNDGCGPLSVQFNNASSSNVTAWSWTFEGGEPSTSTEENPTITFSTPGTYDVTLEVTSAAGTDEILLEDYVEVLNTPTIDIISNVEDQLLTASYNGQGAETFIWIVDGNLIDTEEMTYSFEENGVYLVKLEAANECGSVEKTIEVEIDVFAEIFWNNLPIIVCVGEEFTLEDNSINANQKNWILPGASPSESNEMFPNIMYAETGTYDITLSTSNDLNSVEETFEGAVVVIEEPKASFVGDLTDNMVAFTSDIEGADSFFWDFGDGNTSNEVNPIHTFTTNGEFTVTLIVENQCGTVTISDTYTVISNAVNEEDFKNMTLYPNPAREFINIEINNSDKEIIQLEVLDMSGRIITRDEFKTSKHTLNTNELVQGTYMIRLSTDQNTYLKKIVKF